MYVLPGSLPYGFQLKDPELLRVEEMAELWKHLHQRQQSRHLKPLHFTDNVFNFDPMFQDGARQNKQDKEASEDGVKSEIRSKVNMRKGSNIIDGGVMLHYSALSIVISASHRI